MHPTPTGIDEKLTQASPFAQSLREAGVSIPAQAAGRLSAQQPMTDEQEFSAEQAVALPLLSTDETPLEAAVVGGKLLPPGGQVLPSAQPPEAAGGPPQGLLPQGLHPEPVARPGQVASDRSSELVTPGKVSEPGATQQTTVANRQLSGMYNPSASGEVTAQPAQRADLPGKATLNNTGLNNTPVQPMPSSLLQPPAPGVASSASGTPDQAGAEGAHNQRPGLQALAPSSEKVDAVSTAPVRMHSGSANPAAQPVAVSTTVKPAPILTEQGSGSSAAAPVAGTSGPQDPQTQSAAATRAIEAALAVRNAPFAKALTSTADPLSPAAMSAGHRERSHATASVAMSSLDIAPNARARMLTAAVREVKDGGIGGGIAITRPAETVASALDVKFSAETAEVLPPPRSSTPTADTPRLMAAPAGQPGADASARELGSAVHDQVMRAMSRQALAQGRLTLQLNPRELGAVDIEFSQERGELQVAIVARETAARELLDGALPRLRQSLQDAGISVGDLNVRQERQQGQGDSHQTDGQSPAPGGDERRVGYRDDTAAEHDHVASSPRADGLFDIYV